MSPWDWRGGTEMAVFVLLQIIASVGGKIVHNVNVFVAVVRS